MLESEITDFCRNVVAQILNRPSAEISPDESLSRIGLDSANSVNLILHLEGLLHLELEEDLFVSYPSIAAVAAELARRSSKHP